MGLGWVKGQRRWSAHPLGGAECRDHTHHLAFAPIISEMGVRLWPFRILLFVIAWTVHARSYL